MLEKPGEGLRDDPGAIDARRNDARRPMEVSSRIGAKEIAGNKAGEKLMYRPSSLLSHSENKNPGPIARALGCSSYFPPRAGTLALAVRYDISLFSDCQFASAVTESNGIQMFSDLTQTPRHSQFDRACDRFVGRVSDTGQIAGSSNCFETFRKT